MTGAFEVAAGSIVGREHVAAGKNNQDAFCWIQTPEATIAVVSDGCGSAKHSEVGASLGSRLAAEALRKHVHRLAAWPPSCVLEYVRLELLAALRELATAMGGSLAQTLNDYLLFTVVGAVVSDAISFVFTLGDGVVVVNGATDVLSYPGNQPPYVAYGLTGSAMPEAERFQVRRCLPTAELSSILIGSDGVTDLMRTGDLSPFWEDARYFRNPAALTRRLTLLNRETQRALWDERRLERHHGLLPDDTTLVAIRRTVGP